jgi:2-succinyl-6-hydroxy-2,4-cyclohexadiene-1-carboxylate synthase
MGGRVLLHLAEMYPHVVLRMALLGATAGIADDQERALRRASDEALAEHLLEIGVAAFLDEWLTQPLFAELVVTDADRADRLRNTAEGLAESLRLCGTGVQVSLWDRLRTINVPTLALAGEHDTKFVPIAERLAASLPKGRFATVPAAGHAAHVQQPDVFATKLVEWLQSTRSVVALVR